jgi:hypothetical protein
MGQPIVEQILPRAEAERDRRDDLRRQMDDGVLVAQQRVAKTRVLGPLIGPVKRRVGRIGPGLRPDVETLFPIHRLARRVGLAVQRGVAPQRQPGLLDMKRRLLALGPGEKPRRALEGPAPQRRIDAMPRQIEKPDIPTRRPDRPRDRPLADDRNAVLSAHGITPVGWLWPNEG